MKKHGRSQKIKLEDLPWNAKHAKNAQKLIRTKSLPDIPYRTQLAYLIFASNLWLTKSFRYGFRSSSNFNTEEFWKEFKSSFKRSVKAGGKIDGQRILREAAKTSTRNINKTIELKRRLREISPGDELTRTTAETLNSCLLEHEADQLNRLLDQVRNIQLTWATNPPTTMNSDSMEYLFGGFLLGRFMEVAKAAEMLYRNKTKRTEGECQAVAAVEDKVFQIVRANPSLTPSKLRDLLCKARFKGFRIRRSETQSAKDKSFMYRTGLQVAFHGGKSFRLPRADQLLLQAKEFLPDRRSGRSS